MRIFLTNQQESEVYEKVTKWEAVLFNYEDEKALTAEEINMLDKINFVSKSESEDLD